MFDIGPTQAAYKAEGVIVRLVDKSEVYSIESAQKHLRAMQYQRCI